MTSQPQVVESPVVTDLTMSPLPLQDTGTPFDEAFMGAWLGSMIGYWTAYGALRKHSDQTPYIGAMAATLPGTAIGLRLARADGARTPTGLGAVGGTVVGTAGGFTVFWLSLVAIGGLDIGDIESDGTFFFSSALFSATQAAIAAWIAN